MAKNKKIEIDVKVDDKGTTKKVGLNAKKAGDQLDKLGTSSRTADRNLKGAAQASANGTKNFSKMAQGVGGLVGVYATLAAQAFALSAAFEFLKKVGDLRVLKDSQIAYASSTGVAIRSLSKDIRTAADGMLTFEEASKSAAIGIASGLSSSQLTNLAKGAASVSKVLGRDISDSYDRLVRGVTKAEPELLDELGITLRLEDAKNKYAIAIGKTVKELTLLEQKQAVAAEVQSQLEQKFISTTDAIDTQGNAMKKFSVAFNNVFVSFADYIGGPVEKAATFFAENIKSLIAVIGLFALTIVKSMLPSLDKFGEKARASATEAADAYDRARTSYEQLKQSQSASSTVKGALANVDTKKGSGLDRLRTGSGDVTKRQAAALLKYAKLEKGVYTQLTNHQKLVYKKALLDILGRKETFWQKSKRGWSTLHQFINRGTKKIGVVWSRTMSFMTAMSAKAVSGINKVFKALGIIGLLQMGWDLLKQFGEFLGVIQDAARGLSDFGSNVKSTLDTLESYGKEYSRMGIALDSFMKASKGTIATSKVFTTAGRAASNTAYEIANLVDQMEHFDQLINTPLGKEAIEGTVKDGKYIKGAPDLKPNLDRAKMEAELLAANMKEVFGKDFLVDALGDTGNLFTARMSKIMNGDFTSINSIKNSAEELRQLGAEFELMVQHVDTFNESNRESIRSFDKLVSGTKAYKTSVTDSLDVVLDLIDAHTAHLIGTGKVLQNTAQTKEEKKSLVERLAFLSLIQQKETEMQHSQAKEDIKHKVNSHRMTKLVRERLNREKKITDLKIKHTASLKDFALLQKESVGRDKEKVAILDKQSAAIKIQIDLAEEAAKEMVRLGAAAAQAFEDGVSSGIEGLITGKESSLGDALLGVAKGVGEAVAKELADQLTEKLMSTSFMQSILGAPKQTPEQLMEEAIIFGHTEGAAKWKEAMDAALKKYEDRLKDDTREKVKAPVDEAKRKINSTKIMSTIQPVSLNGAGVQTKDGQTEPTALWIKMATKNGVGIKIIPEGIEPGPVQFGDDGNPVKSIDANSDSNEENTGAVKTLTNTLGRMGVSAASGSTGSGLVGIAASHGLDWLFNSVLATARNGGVFNGAGKVPGYASGGIARGSTSGYPAMLHGTEAVIPLPQGGKIPVEMKNGGATNNNIVVNVSTDGNTQQKKGSTGPDMDKLGGAIAAAVQSELQNQKRSGGILNPYGVA